MSRRDCEPLILAVDLGTSSVRSAFFNAAGRRLENSLASAEYQLRYSDDGAAELNPAALLRATRRCVRATRSLTTAPVRATAGSGFWHSLLGLDRAGRPLTPIYTWADTRCARDAARLREPFDEREVQQRTGCMLRASFWPAKLRWLHRTRPRLFKTVVRWVSPAEWIFEQLFRAPGCSHSMASGTGLYDSRAQQWDDELIDFCRLTTRQLGPLRDCVEAHHTPVFTAIGDGAAGNLGAGATLPRIVAINVGTSAAVRAVAAGDTPLPAGLFRFLIDPNRPLIGGAVSNGGNLHAWCLRELQLPNVTRKIERLLRRTRTGPDHLAILPFWVGERAPTWPENVEGVIAGLTQSTTAVDLLRATACAVFYRLADILERLESAIGPAERVVVAGGIVQSRASLELLADALGRDLEICRDQEASLRGAAVRALEQLGEKLAPPKYRGRVRHDPESSARAREQRQRQAKLEQLFLSAQTASPRLRRKPS